MKPVKLMDRLVTLALIISLAVVAYILYLRIYVPVELGLKSILTMLGQ